ncbi:hypothetical protein H4Q26_016579 [Puccinia striiformis f. sp. tritici PST-130]|nr:hypothetical protein H4Q26_016579 [Puccinia striiformis f. sp. tritici PST-130]
MGPRWFPFAGFDMPLSYTKSGGQIAEHMAVRMHASMKAYTSTLSVIMNEKGGILDDCLITRWEKRIGISSLMPGRRESDLAWINQIRSNFSPDNLQMDVLDGWGLVALQGPNASKILQGLLDNQSISLDQSLFFGQSIHTKVAGKEVHIARSGYTGEDGFEISIKPEDSLNFAELLANQPGAGMCLYGSDLDESVGVGEAGLGWLVGKDRTGFFGEERTRNEKGDLIQRRRVGLVVEKGPPARSGATITDTDGNQIGLVTSGIPSPSLNSQNIAMGTVQSGHHKSGSKLHVLVRGKPRQAEVVKMPFIKSNFYRNSS